MIGEILVINKYLSESKDNPIKSKLGKHEPSHIIAVINDEYWKEFTRKLELVPNSTIHVDNLGNWTISYSKLKGYIRGIIKELKNKKSFLEKLKKKPNFDISNSIVNQNIIDLEIKLKNAWSQLEEQRKMFIIRVYKHTKKKQQTDPNYKPKKDYTWYPYSFLKDLRNNSDIV